MLASSGTSVPSSGAGSVGYVIAAYNNGDFKAIHFDAHACFAIRTPVGSTQSYETHCLSSPGFTPPGPVSSPIRAGRAFVSIRTIVPSPFGDGRLHYGGHDCNFNPADGTAWVGTSTLGAIQLGSTGKENA